jgi:hypothetical protein
MGFRDAIVIFHGQEHRRRAVIGLEPTSNISTKLTKDFVTLETSYYHIFMNNSNAIIEF